MTDTASSPEVRPMPWAQLFTLAAATFMSVTIEMLPTGVMNLMSKDLGVSESQIGMLMTIFAMSVVFTSTPLMYLLRHVPKRLLLVTVFAAFAVGTIGTAIASSYAIIVITRIVTGIAQGVFWASVTAYVGHLVHRSQLTTAVSITSGGGGLAFVLGVPLGTALGQWLGWRTAFLVLAALCLLVAILLSRILPTRVAEPQTDTAAIEVQPAPTAIGDAEQAGRDHGLPKRPRRSMRLVILVCLLCGLTITAHFTYYTYISVQLLGPTGLAHEFLAIALFAYGVTSCIATFTTGPLFSTRSTLGFRIAYALMFVGGGLVTFSHHSVWLGMIGLLAWGVSMGFMPTLLQTRLLAVAPSKHRDLASALYTSGFNLGISCGAYFGGLLLDEFGIDSLGIAFLIGVAAAASYSVIMDTLTARRERAH